MNHNIRAAAYKKNNLSQHFTVTNDTQNAILDHTENSSDYTEDDPRKYFGTHGDINEFSRVLSNSGADRSA